MDLVIQLQENANVKLDGMVKTARLGMLFMEAAMIKMNVFAYRGGQDSYVTHLHVLKIAMLRTIKENVWKMANVGVRRAGLDLLVT